MKRIQCLVVNPIVKPAHYRFFFNCSSRQASRYLANDKIILNKKLITFMDFFNNYGGFPDPKFNPKWRSLDVPISAN